MQREGRTAAAMKQLYSEAPVAVDAGHPPFAIETVTLAGDPLPLGLHPMHLHHRIAGCERVGRFDDPCGVDVRDLVQR